MIPKLLLLNASCAPKINPYEAHFLAAMSYYAYGLDPLSKKLIDIRLNMIPAWAGIDRTRVTNAFIKERMYKIGSQKEYSASQVCFAMNIPLEKYQNFLSTLHHRGGVLWFDFDILGKLKLTCQTYQFGLSSLLIDKTFIGHPRNL